MKLSSDTMNILKNFTAINESIFVKPGNVLETISKKKNILARAEVAESFPTEFGVYDVNNFLSVITLDRTGIPELEFNDKEILISTHSGRSKIRYRKAAKETILIPPEKSINMDSAEIKFTLAAVDFEWITKVASVLSSPNIAFVSDGKNVSVEAFDKLDDAAHANSTDIGEFASEKPFKMIFASENLKLIAGAYDVAISAKGIAHFKNKNAPVEYWITTETGSKYGA